MVLDVSSLDVTAGNEVEARKTGATVVPSDSVMHFYIYIYWAAEEKIERRGRLPHGFFSPGPLQDVALTMLHFESNMLQINQALTI